MKAIHLALVSAGIIFAGSVITGCVQKNDYNSNPHYNGYNNNYGAGNTSGYTYIYDQEFNSGNVAGWVFTDAADSAYSTISDGSLQYVDYSFAKSSTSLVTTQANIKGNFTVQTKLESNKIIGLIFGASATDNGYAFYIDTAGNYSLYKEGIDSIPSQVIIASTSDLPYSIKNNWNTLEIDQINGTWAGYINGTQTFTMTARPISGAGFGFKILPGTIGYAANLVVNSN